MAREELISVSLHGRMERSEVAAFRQKWHVDIVIITRNHLSLSVGKPQEDSLLCCPAYSDSNCATETTCCTLNIQQKA